MSENNLVVGIDVGSQKIMIVRNDGEIILTDTGSVSRPNLISFFGRTRLIGEEAIPQQTGDNTIPLINAFIGKSWDEVKLMEVSKHLKCPLVCHSSGLAAFEVTYCNESRTFDSTTIFAMVISKLAERVKEVVGDGIKLSFALPPDSTPSLLRALKESCTIGGIDFNRISTFDSSDCLVKAYGRKLQAIRESEKNGIQVKSLP